MKDHSMQPLEHDALEQAVGGSGYSSVVCKKCGKVFGDLEQYRNHVETGCDGKPKR